MCNHEFKFRKEKNFDTKLLDFPTLSSLPSSLHFDFKEAGEGSVITFRDNAIKTRPLEYSLHPVLDIDCHSSVQISFRPKRLCYVSTDQGLHMYRAEGGAVVHARIGSLPTGSRLPRVPRWSEISIVTRFRGSVLGRRRTCLWLIRRRPPWQGEPSKEPR